MKYEHEVLPAAHESIRNLEIIAQAIIVRICLCVSVIYLLFSIAIFPYRDIQELLTREEYQWMLQEFISHPLLRLNISHLLFYVAIACVPCVICWLVCIFAAKAQQHTLVLLALAAICCSGLAGLVFGFALIFSEWWSAYPHLFY